jgi:hypothetical protein
MELLYHYCTVEVFHAIVTSGAVRLSSVRHSNDEAEGSMLRESIRRHAVATGCDLETEQAFVDCAIELEGQFDGLALCLSENGDQLSQWRGYANDGRGIALGLDKRKLEALADASEEDDGELGLRLYRAVYKPAEHDIVTQELFRTIREHGIPQKRIEDASGELLELRQRRNALQALLLSLTAYDTVYSLKHEAFSEEQEWRLLHHVDLANSDPHGFHPAASRLAPFISLPLLKNDKQILQEVVLGPRHTSPEATVVQFLRMNGHLSTRVRRSRSPYRRDA